MWLTLCNIRMLQSVTLKIINSQELKTQIQIDSNQTCWVHENSINALSDNETFCNVVHVGNPEDMNLIFGPQLAKLAKK